jgi:hypothetical protein
MAEMARQQRASLDPAFLLPGQLAGHSAQMLKTLPHSAFFRHFGIHTS